MGKLWGLKQGGFFSFCLFVLKHFTELGLLYELFISVGAHMGHPRVCVNEEREAEGERSLYG